jgi:hypothetical protein
VECLIRNQSQGHDGSDLNEGRRPPKNDAQCPSLGRLLLYRESAIFKEFADPLSEILMVHFQPFVRTLLKLELKRLCGAESEAFQKAEVAPA